MSLVTTLIMGFTTKNTQVPFKCFIPKSQVYMRKKKIILLDNILSKFDTTKFTNTVTQKASRVAFKVFNYLKSNQIFKSIRGQMLQHPSTRIMEYAFKAKITASQESTHLIYPHVGMYPLFEQEIQTIYKGKGSLRQICSVFLWMTTALTILIILFSTDKYPFNLFFAPQILNKRKQSINCGLDRRNENAWKKRFCTNKENKVEFNLVSVLLTDNDDILSNFYTSLSKSTIPSSTVNNIQITHTRKNCIKLSKQVLKISKLKNSSKKKINFFVSKHINQFLSSYGIELTNKNFLFFTKFIVAITRKLTNIIMVILKPIIQQVGNWILNHDKFINEKYNNQIKRVQQQICFLFYFVHSTLENFIQFYDQSMKNVLIRWKNPVKKAYKNLNDFYFNRMKIILPINFLNKNRFQPFFLKIIFLKNWIKIKQQLEDVLETFEYVSFFCFAKIQLILMFIKKTSFLKIEKSKTILQKGIKKERNWFIVNLRLHKILKSKNLSSVVQLEIKEPNKLIYEQSFQVFLSIKRLNKTIRNFQQAAIKYLQIIIFFMINRPSYSLKEIVSLINQKKHGQITLGIKKLIENYFEKNKVYNLF
uniref:hypothetical protein n=1 Tax=Klebsormidium crenulatum TaxID=424406 RepID=UPI00286A4C61|nr:hypothetical protein RMD54_pgp093 [Klebsormidium crenulatum]WKT06360.1 hypothetical protein [Klebsormidium crenulatum]